MKSAPRRRNGKADRVARATEAGRKDAERGKPCDIDRFTSNTARDAYVRAWQEHRK